MSTEETTLFEVKQCTNCGQVKKLDAFNRTKGNRDGLESRCRECSKERDKKARQRYRAANSGRDPYDGTIKRCSGVCGRDLLRTEDNWTTAPGRKDGLSHYCRKCDSGLSSDIIDRIEYLWKQEKAKNRGEWIHHGKAEWLDLLISQRGRCALTNEKLTKENVSIDHIVPCGKGGSHDFTNLQLVTNEINKIKRDCVNFSEMCRRVVNCDMNLLCYGTKENPGGETTGAEMRQS